MKKLISILAVIFVMSYATDVYAATYGVKAGLNMSNMVMKDNNGTYSDEFKMLPGFQIGGTAEFMINDNFAFETGLSFTTKGYKYDFQLLGEDINSSTSLYYLDIPLTGKAYFNVQGIDVYGILGPYIGYGLTGTASNDSDAEENEDISFGSSTDDDFKPLDYGLLLGVGAQYKNFEFGVSYSLGLSNISIYEDDDLKVNNRVISVTVGYRFKTDKK